MIVGFRGRTADLGAVFDLIEILVPVLISISLRIIVRIVFGKAIIQGIVRFQNPYLAIKGRYPNGAGKRIQIAITGHTKCITTHIGNETCIQAFYCAVWLELDPVQIRLIVSPDNYISLHCPTEIGGCVFVYPVRIVGPVDYVGIVRAIGIVGSRVAIITFYRISTCFYRGPVRWQGNIFIGSLTRTSAGIIKQRSKSTKGCICVEPCSRRIGTNGIGMTGIIGIKYIGLYVCGHQMKMIFIIDGGFAIYRVWAC